MMVPTTALCKKRNSVIFFYCIMNATTALFRLITLLTKKRKKTWEE